MVNSKSTKHHGTTDEQADGQQTMTAANFTMATVKFRRDGRNQDFSTNTNAGDPTTGTMPTAEIFHIER